MLLLLLQKLPMIFSRLAGRPAVFGLAALWPGCPTAATDRAAGCILVLSDGRAVQRSVCRTDLVDTNGADHAFAAGLLAGLQRDLSLETAADFGMALAAATVFTSGPRAFREARLVQQNP